MERKSHLAKYVMTNSGVSRGALPLGQLLLKLEKLSVILDCKQKGRGQHLNCSRDAQEVRHVNEHVHHQ